MKALDKLDKHVATSLFIEGKPPFYDVKPGHESEYGIHVEVVEGGEFVYLVPDHGVEAFFPGKEVGTGQDSIQFPGFGEFSDRNIYCVHGLRPPQSLVEETGLGISDIHVEAEELPDELVGVGERFFVKPFVQGGFFKTGQ